MRTSVVLLRRSSRSWTSPNVLPTSTPPGCTCFFFSFSKCRPADHGSYCHIFFRHSSGRGGVGNVTAGEAPQREGGLNPHGVNHPHATHSHDAESFGRGGSGNISRDPSREPGVKNTRNPLSGFLHGLAHGSGGNSKGEQRGRSIGREGDLVATG
jgi:hypothetical protein